MFKITFNQFLIDKRTQRYHPLRSLAISGLDSDRIMAHAKNNISKIASFFIYGKYSAWRIRSSFLRGQRYTLAFDGKFFCYQIRRKLSSSAAANSSTITSHFTSLDFVAFYKFKFIVLEIFFFFLF